MSGLIDKKDLVAYCEFAGDLFTDIRRELNGHGGESLALIIFQRALPSFNNWHTERTGRQLTVVSSEEAADFLMLSNESHEEA